MGNSSKKLSTKCNLLSKEEHKFVSATFAAICRSADRLREDDLIVSGKVDAVTLEKFWGPSIDARFAQYLTNYLFGHGPQRAQYVEFNKFAELYVYSIRGNVNERLMMTYRCLGKDSTDGVELPYQLIKEYCESIASTYIKVLKSNSCPYSQSWLSKGFSGRAVYVQALGAATAASMAVNGELPQHCTADQIAAWLQRENLLQQLSELIFMHLYGINKKMEDESPSSPPSPPLPSLLPTVEGLDAMPEYPAFIDISHIVWINSHLPHKHQHKWRFLFSSHIHGESFSTMTGRITDQGASLVIVEDNSGYIFGGYAPESWILGPNFYGTEESFLFTIKPKMRFFGSSGFNNHYQYINHNTKTLPNGLLMGGQFDFGAIWINADPFGEGSSAESCTTYRGYKRLSRESNFHIRSLEVWGVGEKPLTVKESGERDLSVLDADPEVKAILELTGRMRHSDGIREPPQL